MIARARHTAQKMAQHSSQLAASRSFLSWFGAAPPDLSRTFAGADAEESEECLKKTHEFLERALENLCQIFKVRSCRSMPAFNWVQPKVLIHLNCPAQFHILVVQLNQSQMTQLMSSLDSSQDDGNSRQLPDCTQGENGLVLTDLGRKQVGGFQEPAGCVCA